MIQWLVGLAVISATIVLVTALTEGFFDRDKAILLKVMAIKARLDQHEL